MKVYTISKTHIVKVPLDLVFNFFSKPENLAKITPKKLAFRILTPTPIEMGKGTVIDYTIKLMGLRIHWKSLISKYNPPNEFVDEQLKGPYSFWNHSHTFKQVSSGVEISDHVNYSIPMGILGRFMHVIWIKSELEKIFKDRKAVIEQHLLSVKSNSLRNESAGK